MNAGPLWKNDDNASSPAVQRDSDDAAFNRPAVEPEKAEPCFGYCEACSDVERIDVFLQLRFVLQPETARVLWGTPVRLVIHQDEFATLCKHEVADPAYDIPYAIPVFAERYGYFFPALRRGVCTIDHRKRKTTAHKRYRPGPFVVIQILFFRFDRYHALDV